MELLDASTVLKLALVVSALKTLQLAGAVEVCTSSKCLLAKDISLEEL